jgi:hypothetical protein
MSIGNCDCCDRRDVPGSVVDCPGEPFACFICQGDDNPDPYGEIEITCDACDGAGCDRCSRTGCEWIATQPVTLEDLQEAP